MHTNNLLVILPFLSSVLDLVSPEQGIGDAHLIGQLPFMPGPFPSKTYSGFIDISSEKSIHYALTESEYSPESDPLIIWYSGGPGCSSMLGLFTEVGPFTIQDEATEFTRNEYAWNKKANVLYIDQPAGTGYSIGRTEQALHSSDTQSASDNLLVLLQFFKMYPRFRSRDVYITGESYTGAYGPLLAETIDENNSKHLDQYINLKGVMIGNPKMASSLFTYRYLLDSFQRGLLPKDLKNDFYKYDCQEAPQEGEAQKKCSRIAETFFYATRYINQYDIYRKCSYAQNVSPELWPRLDNHLKCVYKGPLEEMLNDAEFKSAFNVDVEGVPHWQHCSDILDYDINVKSLIPTYQKLRHKYKLLIFNGDTDQLLGFGHTMRGVRMLGWETKEDFTQWYLEKEFVGYKWVVDGLTVATIHGVGHMAASWKAKEVQALIYDFIDGYF